MAESISLINNGFYDHLNSLWYEGGEDHPISLLRAENRVRTPWVAKTIEDTLGASKHVLDVGCGAGLLSNFLSLLGHQVTGIDLSYTSLRYAKERDVSKSVRYLQANANSMPFEDDSFDAVCAMDLLEHVETPWQVVREAARVLKPGGVFFFHTFNRNLLSYLMIIKAVEWFIPRTPKNMHVYNLFIKPEELQKAMMDVGFGKPQFVGLRPAFMSRATWRMVLKRRVESDFLFKFVKSLKTGYCGFATLKSC